MSDQQLTTLSTICWIAGTTTLFILLAHWSSGGSWGISTAIVRGLTGWSGRGGAPHLQEEDLTPMAPPRLDRLWGDRTTSPEAREGLGLRSEPLPLAELEDLGSHRIQ